MELDVGVALAEEEQRDRVEPRGELGRGDDLAGGRVGDAVEHDRRRAVAPGRVADREIEDVRLRPGGGGQGEESGESQPRQGAAGVRDHVGTSDGSLVAIAAPPFRGRPRERRRAYRRAAGGRAGPGRGVRAPPDLIGSASAPGGTRIGATHHAMFEGLQEKFQEVFRRLKGEGRITQEHLSAALKELRLALLEGDVHFRVVKDFLGRVEQKAIGEKVLDSLSPAQQVIGIVHDELVATLGGTDAQELRVAGAPAVILMCGLQGSGKTTTSGKLGRRLAARGRYPLLVAADLQRAAAVEQLVQVGARVELPVLRPEPGEGVIELGRRALRVARERGRDVVLIDTAGRLHVDQALMAEIKALADAVDPDEILYVADAMTGQDAVKSAQEFAAVLPLTGVLLTKLDGDTRGGAALSIREVAKVPIRFAGVGEKPEDLELFSPARMASRILGMGDVMALIERAQETVDAKEAQRLAERLSRQEFTLEDLRDQLRQVKKLGSLQSIVDMLPRMGPLKGMPKVGDADEKRLARVEAIINSMTPAERRNPGLLQASRKKRIARGSGTSVQEINQLLKQYLGMKKMMKGVKGSWLKRAFRA